MRRTVQLAGFGQVVQRKEQAEGLLDPIGLMAAASLRAAEEAGELADAATPAEVAWETADVIYFALVAMARAGVDLTRTYLGLGTACTDCHADEHRGQFADRACTSVPTCCS